LIITLAWFDIHQVIISSLGWSIGPIAPALLVHFWLLLFAGGALGIRLLYSLFRATEWAQWFLRAGNRHPLRAIGMVGAVLVFVGTAIARLLAQII
jgi:hypothetical protein